MPYDTQLDPRIILGAGKPSGPFGPDMSQIYQSQNQAYRNVLQQQDLAGQNALRGAFQNQNMLNPNTGLPNTQALGMVGQVDPKLALEYMAATQKINEEQQRAQVTGLMANQKIGSIFDKQVVTPLVTYAKDLQTQNIPQDQQDVMIEQKRQEFMKDMQKSQGFSDSTMNKLDTKYDPVRWPLGSEGFKKREEDIAKGWKGPYTDSKGAVYWLNEFLGPGAFNQDRTAPYNPVGAARTAGQEPKPMVDVKPDGTKVPIQFDPLNNTYLKDNEPYKPTNPQRIGVEGGKGAGPKNLPAPLEADIKNPDTGKSERRGIRQEQLPDGTVRTVFAGGPDAGKEVPKEQLGEVRTKGEQAGQEAIDATAESIADYRTPPLSPYAQVRGNGPEIMEAIKKANPEYNAQKYYQANSVRQDFARGAASKRIDALNTVTQHLEVFDDLGKALKNGDVNAVNSVVNYAKTQLGHPEVTSFNAAKDVVADEVIKAVIGSGAVFDREGMTKNLSGSRSPEQLHDVEVTIKRLMAGQVGSLEKRWTSVGLKKDEFGEKLLPDTLAAVDEYLPKEKKGEGSGSSQTQPSSPSGSAFAPLPGKEHFDTLDQTMKSLPRDGRTYPVQDKSTGQVHYYKNGAEVPKPPGVP
jgi:hypothetical protein